MEDPGGGGANGGGSGGASAGGGALGGTHGGGSDVEDLEELFPSRPSSAAAMLARIWVENPATSAQWTCGFGGGIE